MAASLEEIVKEINNLNPAIKKYCHYMITEVTIRLE